MVFRLQIEGLQHPDCVQRGGWLSVWMSPFPKPWDALEPRKGSHREQEKEGSSRTLLNKSFDKFMLELIL